MLHWISNILGSNTAASLASDPSSGRLTLYLSSNFVHEASKNNATRLLDIMRKSFSVISTGGNQSDLEDEYLAFVTDVCWERLQDKVNRRVPRFPIVPQGADVSTMSSVLKTIIELAEAWNAWRLRTGIPENSTQIMRMKENLNHSQSFDTLKYCFEQVFCPLDNTEDHLQQLAAYGVAAMPSSSPISLSISSIRGGSLILPKRHCFSVVSTVGYGVFIPTGGERTFSFAGAYRISSL